jgi:hypothetical protein
MSDFNLFIFLKNFHSDPMTAPQTRSDFMFIVANFIDECASKKKMLNWCNLMVKNQGLYFSL